MTIVQAFRNFVKYIYPDLTPEEKNKLKSTVSRFNNMSRKPTNLVSETKLAQILKKFGYTSSWSTPENK